MVKSKMIDPGSVINQSFGFGVHQPLCTSVSSSVGMPSKRTGVRIKGDNVPKTMKSAQQSNTVLLELQLSGSRDEATHCLLPTEPGERICPCAEQLILTMLILNMTLPIKQKVPGVCYLKEPCLKLEQPSPDHQRINNLAAPTLYLFWSISRSIAVTKKHQKLLAKTPIIDPGHQGGTLLLHPRSPPTCLGSLNTLLRVPDHSPPEQRW